MVELIEVIRVFISSKQNEFQHERQRVENVIRNLPLLAPDLAEDWSPERESVENTFLRRVRAAPIYVGFFGCIYSAPTCLEYETARENPRREILIYIKECSHRDPLLDDFIHKIDNPKSGHTIKSFKNWDDLKPYFETHLWAAIRRMIENYIQLKEPEPATRGPQSFKWHRWNETRQQLLDIGLPGAHDPEKADVWAHELTRMLNNL